MSDQNQNIENKPVTTIYINGEPVRSSAALPRVKNPKPVNKRDIHPTIFSGPKLKIERAKGHIADLQSAIKTFHETRPYELIKEQDPKTGEDVYRMKVHKDVPFEIGGIIGDAVHNLRAALDLLVCDLVRSNMKQVVRGNGFPISRTANHFESNSVGKIKGVNRRAERLIRRLKPYEGGNTPLWILHELDALDKHQGIIPVAAAHVLTTVRWAMPFMFIGPDNTLRIGSPGPDGQPHWLPPGVPHGVRNVYPLTDNSEIYRSAPTGFYEDVQASVTVAFSQAQIVDGEPVVETLNQLVVFIERAICIFERKAI